MAMDVPGARTKHRPAYLKVAFATIGCILGFCGLAPAQQPIAPIDFRPFVDGRNWIVRQPLVYTIGVSKDSLTVPIGFVTDFASIPQVFHYLLRQNGFYLLPAVVHDYLYWTQTCTRDQSTNTSTAVPASQSRPRLFSDHVHGSSPRHDHVISDHNHGFYHYSSSSLCPYPFHPCPVPRFRNNFSGLISQSLWPSLVKYTAAGVR
ncbi:MAG: DUF1353 domain-containing protein [Candidatus Binatia bacterium]